MRLSAFERSLKVRDVVLSHPGTIVQSFGGVWRDRPKRGDSHDQAWQERGTGKRMWATTRNTPNQKSFPAKNLCDLGYIVGSAGDAPAWMPCRFSVAWPFVADQSN